MTSRGFGNIFVSASVGAMATIAGVFIAKKMKNYFSRKPRMRLFHRHLSLSTRCTWLISELGVGSDFDVTEEEPPIMSKSNSMELLMIENLPTENAEFENGLPLLPRNPADPDASEMEPDYPESAYDSSTCSTPTLPAVVVNDEFTMIEGAAICMYLADLYGQFLPDAEHKAEYYSWIVYSAATFDNIIRTLQKEIVDNSESSRDEVALSSAVQGFHAFARAISAALENRDYLCGKNFTAADCVLGFTLWWAYTLDNGRLLGEHPLLMSYLDRLRERPAFKETFGTDPENWDWSRYFTTYVRGIQQCSD